MRGAQEVSRNEAIIIIALSTRDWLPCSLPNGITLTVAHCAGCIFVWAFLSYDLPSSLLEELDSRSSCWHAIRIPTAVNLVNIESNISSTVQL